MTGFTVLQNHEIMKSVYQDSKVGDILQGPVLTMPVTINVKSDH
jgi:hypothetical protein